MTAPPNYITPQGLAKLREEYDHLRKVARPAVVQEVADAAAMGDRSENAEYIYGKRRLREIDRRLRFLQTRIDAAVVVEPANHKGDRVFFGATVVLEDEQGAQRTLRIVGEDEIDADAGRISHRSPVGAALLGKYLDDEVRVMTPQGSRTLAIVAVRYD